MPDGKAKRKASEPAPKHAFSSSHPRRWKLVAEPQPPAALSQAVRATAAVLSPLWQPHAPSVLERCSPEHELDVVPRLPAVAELPLRRKTRVARAAPKPPPVSMGCIAHHSRQNRDEKSPQRIEERYGRGCSSACEEPASLAFKIS